MRLALRMHCRWGMEDPCRASIRPKSVWERFRVYYYLFLGSIQRCAFQTWRFAGYPSFREASRWLAKALLVTSVPLCGFVCTEVVGPRVFVGFIQSKHETTKMTMLSIANEAYLQWTMKTGELCPDTPLDLRFDCDTPRICTLTLTNTGEEPIYLRKALDFDSTPIIRTVRLVYLAPNGEYFEPSPYSTTPDILGTFGWMGPSETVVGELDQKTLLMVCEESGHEQCAVHVEYELEEVPELFKDKPYWQGIVKSNPVTIVPP